MDDIEPKNAGLPWTMEQNEQLAEWLVKGISIGTIASWLGRSSGAVRGQAVKFAPADLGLGTGEVIGWLRVQLQHGHDWKAVLKERSVLPLRNGERWSDAENERLVNELQGGASWSEIAALHERTKVAVIAQASRLLALDDVSVAMPRARRADRLRDELQNKPDYDWRRALRVNQAAGRSPSWVFVAVGHDPDGNCHLRVAATESAAERAGQAADVPEGVVWETFERAVLPDYLIAGGDS